MDKRIGIQLYTVRDLCTTRADFESTVKRLADIGFKAVQVSGIPEISGDPEYLRAVFEKNGLECVATHFTFDRYDNDIEEMAEYHKKLNCKLAGIVSIPLEMRRDLSTLRETVKKCNKFNERLMRDGIKFAWHNHAFDYAKVSEDKTVMDVILDEGEFSLILDVYWLAFVGVNPAKFIKKNEDRISIVHYKDIRACNINAVEYAEVGQGNIEWDEVINASQKPDFAVIEQDKCEGNPLASVKKSYDFLTQKYDFI